MYSKKFKRKTFHFLQKAKLGLQSAAAKAEGALMDKSGQLAADHAGWIAVAFVIIAVVLVFAFSTMKDTVLPGLKDKFTGFMNYNG